MTAGKAGDSGTSGGLAARTSRKGGGEDTKTAGQAECWNAEPRTHLGGLLGAGACLSSNRGQKKGWPQRHCWGAGEIGPGPRVANKPLTDSKNKFLLIIYLVKLIMFLKNYFNRIAFRRFLIVQL